MSLKIEFFRTTSSFLNSVTTSPNLSVASPGWVDPTFIISWSSLFVGSISSPGLVSSVLMVLVNGSLYSLMVVVTRLLIYYNVYLYVYYTKTCGLCLNYYRLLFSVSRLPQFVFQTLFAQFVNLAHFLIP